MIFKNVYSRTKAKGCLYYNKDVGTLGLAAILAMNTWLVLHTGFRSEAHCRVAEP